ncbi:YkvA family protein [Cryobacterium sp. HLT2-28]|uniref:YkvA family protein n=1 Tax=Cryobacterium sp. HLT2-28 TaxID=1259146 RepID=UPI001068D649|nr:DUF1232 domain-containing protein [Cryobacterium sp. HLT2-28]TFB95366.1 DUF1232 domain-containing protein [Cryobacterium sp. HLT2-28]
MSPTGPEWWEIVLGVAGGILLLWLVLVGLLWRAARKQSDPTRLRDALRLIPDVVRLLRRLAADRTVSAGVRVWLVVLLGYLLSPIDLVPDFIPVLGYADDAIIVALVLRFVTRRAGAEAIERHWPGTPQGLAALRTLAGI